MKEELQNKLYEDFPKIFRQKDLPMSDTCMCWGICVDDGWYNLIRNLCAEIQAYVDHSGIKQVEASQVKEKFGGLRFYTDGGDKKVYELIRFAENLSYKTCEICEKKGELLTRGGHEYGWRKTLCDECAKQEGYSKINGNEE